MWFLLACARPDPVDAADLARYRDALRTGACETVTTSSLRDDCWLSLADEGRRTSMDPGSAGRTFVSAAGPNLAPPDDVCDRVEDSFLRDECWFLRAEATEDFALCKKAATFHDSCRLHLLTQRFARAPAARLGEGEDAAREAILAAGFELDDLRPWSTWYRWILARQTPLDRPACRSLPDPARVSACEEMALIVYKGRLQLARDHGRNPCAQPVPADLAYVPDPAVDTVRGAMGCR